MPLLEQFSAINKAYLLSIFLHVLTQCLFPSLRPAGFSRLYPLGSSSATVRGSQAAFLDVPGTALTRIGVCLFLHHLKAYLPL